MSEKVRSLTEILSAHGAMGPNDLVIRANAERAEFIASLITGGIAFVRRTFRRVATRIETWLENDRVRRELAGLSDRELADIGLSKSDLARRDLAELAEERRAAAAPAPANQNRQNGRAAPAA